MRRTLFRVTYFLALLSVLAWIDYFVRQWLRLQVS